MDEALEPKNVPGKALLVALVASVAAHVLLLSLVHLSPRRQASVPDLTVSLVGTFVVRQAAPPAQQAAVPTPAPPTPRPNQAALRETLPPRAATSAAQGAAPASRPPVSRVEPFEGRAWPELVGRRLSASVRLNPDGTVASAHVPPNEISAELVQRLEQALAQVRFPAGARGSDGDTEIRTRLCFDDAGRLDTLSDGCWPHAAEPAR